MNRHTQIEKEAFLIYLDRLKSGDPDAANSHKNWLLAEQRISYKESVALKRYEKYEK